MYLARQFLKIIFHVRFIRDFHFNSINLRVCAGVVYIIALLIQLHKLFPFACMCLAETQDAVPMLCLIVIKNLQ